MRVINTKEIEQAIYQLALKSCKTITPECVNALKDAINSENNELSKTALTLMVENSVIANEQDLPVCQDTGLACVILSIGQHVFFEGELLSDAINNGVRRAYKDGFFRKSTADPITRENYGDNTPAVIHTEIVDGDKVEISFIPKGFGSENMSRIYMLTPSQGIKGIIDSIVETVRLAGSKPCPPVLVGVGIGGTFDKCAFLAKKALTRPVGTFSERNDVKEIEIIAKDEINKLNIGAQGFKGNTTCIGVNCEVAPTHIAGLPVAVNIQCHCVRTEKVVL